MCRLLKFSLLLICSLSVMNFFSDRIFAEEYYNDPPGTQELNIYGIEKKREIISTGVISPDKSLMSYSVVHFYPNNRQFTSKVFITGNVFQIKTTDKMARSILESGLDSFDKHIFRTLTIVDWSADSKKLLIKESVGEYFRSIWATNIFVYNFDTGNAKSLDNIRKAIVYYWKNNQNLDLYDYRWDVIPLGWDINNPDMVIVNAYGYGDSGKQFLGCWGIDTFNDTAKLLSLSNEKLPVARNGFKFVPHTTKKGA